MDLAERALAAGIAAVWLHQGLWCKVLRRDERHEQIVADVPLVGPGRARAATAAIGAGEVAVAAWVLGGWRPVPAARTQTVLLVAMNVGGLACSSERIPAPGRMLLRNTGLLAAIWAHAARRRRT